MRHQTWSKRSHLYFPTSSVPPPFSATQPAPSPHPLPAHLGLVGLLQLQLVETHLLVVLAAQLLKCLRHLEVVLLLPAAVHLHQAPLVPPACLPHLLGKGHAELLRQAAGLAGWG